MQPSAPIFVPLALVGVLAIGCSEPASDLHPVAGQVLLDSALLTTGSVSYRPDEARGNKSLHHPTGAIDAEGRYELFTAGRVGAPPGWYKVVVHATEPTGDSGKASPGMPKSIIDSKYNQPATTPLAVEVVADAPAGRYDLHLDN